MASSDSEGFESADEGQQETEKTPRKHRKSSSNYSDNALETVPDISKPAPKPVGDIKEAGSTGWDDFDVDVPEIENVDDKKSSDVGTKSKETVRNEEQKDSSHGWDTFDDWEDEGGTQEMAANAMSSQLAATCISQPSPASTESGTAEVSSAVNTPGLTDGSGWGWGWGVDSLLSTATAGITSLTNQVSQGLTTVIESGIGAPDPEELARRPPPATPQAADKVKESMASESDGKTAEEDNFPFGNILKLVGSTGSKVVTGGLDTLESLGRKTMDILTDGDPGLARKRAFIGLEQRPVLSAVLREAAARPEPAAEPHLSRTEALAKEVRYESLFDDFGGLIHLEALEMLSRQVGLRIEQRIGAADPAARSGLRETLQQVEELCEMADDDDDEDGDDEDGSGSGATLHEALLKATEDLGVKLQFQPLVKQYDGVITLLSDDTLTPSAVYKHAITSLAEATALAVEIYHKTAEMLLVKPRRSTADEADSFTQMTVVLTKHLNRLALLFTEKLNAIHKNNDDSGEQNNEPLLEKSSGERNAKGETSGKADMNGFVTNVFLEAENSCKYLQNALQLELPILQIGAV